MFRSVILSLMFILAGCTTMSTVNNGDSVSIDEGLAIFRLTSNARSIGFFQYWQNVELEDVKTGRKYSINYSNAGNSQSGIYFGSVPEGEFRLTMFSSESCGSVCINSTLYLSEALGTFEVKAGRLTDLGHLIYQPISEERSIVVRSAMIKPWLKDYIAEYYPKIPLSFVDADYLGWNDTPKSFFEHKEAYNLVLKYAQGLFSPHETIDGKVLFGTKLGNLRMWLPTKGLYSIPTGYQGVITAVTTLNDKTWVVGTEDGSMKVTHDAGLTWYDKLSPFKNEGITYLHTYKGNLYAVGADTEKADIYYESGTEGWKQISSHAIDFNIWTGGLRYPVTKAYKNKLVTALPGAEIIVTDMEQLKTKTKTSPGTVMDLTLGKDGVIRVKATQLMIVDPYESHDFGKTWVESAQSRFMVLPYFIDEKNGYGLQGEWLSADASLSKSDDGGKTWHQMQALPYRTPAFGYVTHSKTLFANDQYDTIIFSQDAGKTWNLVR